MLLALTLRLRDHRGHPCVAYCPIDVTVPHRFTIEDLDGQPTLVHHCGEDSETLGYLTPATASDAVEQIAALVGMRAQTLLNLGVGWVPADDPDLDPEPDEENAAG